MSNRLKAAATRVIFSREKSAVEHPAPAQQVVFASVNGHAQAAVVIGAITTAGPKWRPAAAAD